MLEQLGSVLASLRALAPAPLLALTFAASFLLFGPEALLEQLGVLNFRNENRGGAGSAFLFSSCLILANIFWWIRGKAAKLLDDRSIRKAQRTWLDELSSDEKAYLRPYVDGETTQTFGLGDGIAASLVGKGIIYRASNIGHVGVAFPFNIQPWALRLLQKRPELLRDTGRAPKSPRRLTQNG